LPPTGNVAIKALRSRTVGHPLGTIRYRERKPQGGGRAQV